MKLLFIADIVGRPGRVVLKENLLRWKAELGVDLTFANGENAAGGFGLTAALAHELRGYGIDAITLGNHSWDQTGFEKDIENLDFVCRPANLPTAAPGRTHLIVTAPNGLRVGLFTALGQHAMDIGIERSPALCLREMLALLEGKVDAIVAEIHAEFTGEKAACAHYLDGRAALVVGTHTHIQTADARILPKSTAFITDVGMTGAIDSILGFNTEQVVGKFLDSLPRKMEVPNHKGRMNGCLVDIDDKTGLARSIRALQLED